MNLNRKIAQCIFHFRQEAPADSRQWLCPFQQSNISRHDQMYDYNPKYPITCDECEEAYGQVKTALKEDRVTDVEPGWFACPCHVFSFSEIIEITERIIKGG